MSIGSSSISYFIENAAQNHALNAIVVLYKHVPRIDLGEFGNMESAKRSERLPKVITKALLSTVRHCSITLLPHVF
jgi:hypothetical protein